MKSLLTKIISALTIFTLCLGLTACNTPFNNENCNDEHNLVRSAYTAPTCKTNGEESFTCSRCGYVETETLLSINHDYRELLSTPSTCTTHGSTIYECSMCHESKVEALPLGDTHKYTAVNTATCFANGELKNICGECGHEQVINETIMLEHDFGADGYCTKCGIHSSLFCGRFSLTGTRPLIYVGGELTPNFKNAKVFIPNSYWAEHSVSLTVSLYSDSNNLLGSHTFTSSIIESEGNDNGKFTIQYLGTSGATIDNKEYGFIIYFGDNDIFSSNILNSWTFLKLTFSCERYTSFEMSYDTTNGFTF